MSFDEVYFNAVADTSFLYFVIDGHIFEISQRKLLLFKTKKFKCCSIEFLWKILKYLEQNVLVIIFFHIIYIYLYIVGFLIFFL